METSKGKWYRGQGLPEGSVGLELSVCVRDWREMRLEKKLDPFTKGFLIVLRMEGYILRSERTAGPLRGVV